MWAVNLNRNFLVYNSGSEKWMSFMSIRAVEALGDTVNVMSAIFLPHRSSANTSATN
jgi:hypothetical protein